MKKGEIEYVDCVYILPATDPSDTSFGLADAELAALELETCRVERIVFAQLVWYNAAVRAEVFAQIAACEEGQPSPPRRYVVGFSKSGCGALNLLLDRPDFFAGALIFDAPFFNEAIDRWQIDCFYESPEALYVDTAQGREAEWASLAGVEITLVAGENFKADTARLAQGLQALGLNCRAELSQPLLHRWDSGWLTRFWPVRPGGVGGS